MYIAVATRTVRSRTVEGPVNAVAEAVSAVVVKTDWKVRSVLL